MKEERDRDRETGSKKNLDLQIDAMYNPHVAIDMMVRPTIANKYIDWNSKRRCISYLSTVAIKKPEVRELHARR